MIDATVAEQENHARRSTAIRSLLAAPLLSRSAPAFVAVATEADWLTDWFTTVCGWPLLVDARRGFARLRKVNAVVDTSRPLRSHRTKKSPFTRRHYVLFCLAAAALGEHSRSKMSLRELVEGVSDLAVRAQVAVFDPTDTAERRALVDVLVALTRYGMIIERDRAGKDYVHDATTNVLYELDERRLASLIAAPIPPSRCDTWTELTRDRYDTSPSAGSADDTAVADQPRRHARRRVMRRLLDDPVCHIADLGSEEQRCLREDHAQIERWLGEAGFTLERRAEAWIAVDDNPDAPARSFPGTAIVSQAALLLLDTVLTTTDARWVSRTRAEEVVKALLGAHPRWAKSARGDDGVLLARDSLALLTECGLATPRAEGWDISPAAWRWSVDLQPDDDSDTATSDAQGELFLLEDA